MRDSFAGALRSLIPTCLVGKITLLNNLSIIARVVQNAKRSKLRREVVIVRSSRVRSLSTQRSSASNSAIASADTQLAVEDRRITRSKRALRDALVELIEERGLTNFSASDLCARADLNRGTLYNNFGDMEGLLAALEDDIMDDLENLQSCMQRLSLKDVLRYRVNKKPMPFLVNLFDYLREQGDFLHAIMGPKGDPSFGPRVRDAVCTEIIQTILHERYRNDPSPFVQYYVAFYASAYLGVITHWIETGMKESSQEMALVAMRLFFIKPGDPIRL